METIGDGAAADAWAPRDHPSLDEFRLCLQAAAIRPGLHLPQGTVPLTLLHSPSVPLIFKREAEVLCL